MVIDNSVRSATAGFPGRIFAPLVSREVLVVFHFVDTFVCSAYHSVRTSEFANKLS